VSTAVSSPCAEEFSGIDFTIDLRGLDPIHAFLRVKAKLKLIPECSFLAGISSDRETAKEIACYSERLGCKLHEIIESDEGTFLTILSNCNEKC